MAKSLHNDVYDAALNKIATATRLSVCSSDPGNFAGISAASLANSTMGAGDFTNADGDVSGRKVTVGQKTGITVDSTGTGNHLALDDGSILLLTSTAPPQVISSTGNTITSNAFDVELADPS